MDRDLDANLMLDRQQLRRNQGIPTLTVFVGPVGVSIHVWKNWNGDRPVAIPPGDALLSPIASWTAAAIASGGLRAAAIQWFAKGTGLLPSDAESRWSTSTPHDLGRSLEGIPVRHDGAFALCRRLLTTAPRLGSIDARSIAESLCAEARARGESEEAFLTDLTSLMSPEHCPAILLIPERENVEPFVRRIGRLLSAVPTLPVALAIADDVAESVLKQSPEDRWRAVLREGVIKVEGVTREAILERLEATGVATPELTTSLDVLVAGGTSPDAVDQFVEAASALKPEASEEEEDCARSSAERFLFGLLESMPRTVGVFQLNQQLEFRHGPKAAEADLLAADCKLVVEIDGSYYHLKSQDAYRRDRRKDWLFQRHGYRVLRFLAEDVVTQLEEILNTILAALEMCRSDLTQKGQSP
jgi:very-short-patch-repair endonuclease